MPADPTMIEAMLTARDVARLLAIGRRTLQTWRACGRFPPPDFSVGKVRRWRRASIERFIEQHRPEE